MHRYGNIGIDQDSPDREESPAGGRTPSGARTGSRMATTLTAQDTTAAPVRVSLPELDFGIYRAIVRNMQAASPDQRERIGRGVNVLLTAEIRETAECGVYLVQTSTYSDLYYRTTVGRCTCPDALQRQIICKHSHAISILHTASAIAARQQVEAAAATNPIPYTLTRKALAALDVPEPAA
jgi:hypothetical protein